MNRDHLLALLLAAGAATTGLVAQPEIRLPREVVPTTLEHLRSTPDAFKGVRVQFDIQFCSLGKISNPFFTEFEPSRFANFYAWSGEQAIWRKAQYDDLFGCFFVEKENPIVDEIYRLQLYDRLRVTAVVRNVFQDKPWIDVEAFERLPDSVDTPTLAHLYRAERHMADRDWQKAIRELSMAPSEAKPEFVRSTVHQNLAVCYLRVGEAVRARGHLTAANQLREQSDRELTRLTRVAQENPQSEIDRGVDRDSIAEADRPLWEAFEEGRPARPQR